METDRIEVGKTDYCERYDRLQRGVHLQPQWIWIELHSSHRKTFGRVKIISAADDYSDIHKAKQTNQPTLKIDHSQRNEEMPNALHASYFHLTKLSKPLPQMMIPITHLSYSRIERRLNWSMHN